MFSLAAVFSAKLRVVLVPSLNVSSAAMAFMRQIRGFDQRVALMTSVICEIHITGQTRQFSYIHSNGGCNAVRAGYGERIAIHATYRNRDRGCPAVNASIRDGDRHDDLKRRAGVCAGLELAFRNQFQ